MELAIIGISIIGVVFLVRMVASTKDELAAVKESLILANMTAQMSTESVVALSRRVNERDKEMRKMVDYVEKSQGTDGLVGLLNEFGVSVPESDKSDDDDEGMHN